MYRERLWPSPGLLIALILIIPATLLVFLPINPEVGVAVAIVLYAGSVVALVISSPTITVTDRELHAGYAQIPLDAIAEVEAYIGSDATQQRGPLLDARAWLIVRGWVQPVLKVTLNDSDDPTPYWLLSTRRPAQLADAITQHRSV